MASYSKSETNFGGAEDRPEVRASGLCGLDFVPQAAENPFTSAGSLNFDVFRKVTKLLSAKNSKQEGQIGWAGKRNEPEIEVH